MPDVDRAAIRIEIGRLQCQRLRDAKTGPPHDDDQGFVACWGWSSAVGGGVSTRHRRHRKSRAVEVQRGGIEERIGFRGLRDFGVTRPAESCPSQSHGGRREETNLATTATPSPTSPACSSSADRAQKKSSSGAMPTRRRHAIRNDTRCCIRCPSIPRRRHAVTASVKMQPQLSNRGHWIPRGPLHLG